MKKEQVAMLVGGFAFGVLVGFGLSEGLGGKAGEQPRSQPVRQNQGPPPAGPAQAGAPMMEEIGRLRETLKLDPKNLQAMTRLANLYHDAQMWSQAVEFYEQAVELQPDNPNLLTDLGTCYGGLGRNSDAVAMFRRAQAADPNHWQSLFNTVIIAGLNMHDFETAEAALAKMREMPAARTHVPRLEEALAQARAQH